MRRLGWAAIALVAVVAASVAGALAAGEPQPAPGYKSPMYVAFSPDGRFAYATLHTADALAVIDTAQREVVGEIAVGRERKSRFCKNTYVSLRAQNTCFGPLGGSKPALALAPEGVARLNVKMGKTKSCRFLLFFDGF